MSVFSHIGAKKPRYNTFDLSHDRKMSIKMGELVPMFLAETVPGDTFNMSTSQMLRFAPMIAPVMHRVTVYTHFFFVPNRLIWPNWEKFITGGEDGLDTTAFPFLHVNGWSVKVGSVGDYFGLPTQKTLGNISAIPLAAYHKIYNEYYRDQNLIDPITDDVIDGNNSSRFSGNSINSNCRKRSWQHDYFTSALPWTQKGPQATIPLFGDGIALEVSDDPTDRRSQTFKSQQNDTIAMNGTFGAQTGKGGEPGWFTPEGNWLGGEYYFDPGESLVVAGAEGATATINELRRAFKLQEWLEKNARGGSRYIETIMSHFGVRSSDSRLQRPEFLGGGSTPVTISEVLQTSDASAQETPQGNMAGHAISVGRNNSFRYRCEEHGHIIGIMSVMPKTAYQDGIPKQFLKFDKFDYYWPSFANIGEQPIEKREVWVDGLPPETSNGKEVWGYIPRYAEYKYMNDSVHGEFRNSLDFWHMGRKFANEPHLNQEFIEMDDSETSRVFAVTDTEKLYVHLFHKVKAKRPMPYFGTPTI